MCRGNFKYGWKSDTSHDFSHKDLMKGVKIRIEMRNFPNEKRGIAWEDVPHSFSRRKMINLELH